jgi:hypothetical protein
VRQNNRSTTSGKALVGHFQLGCFDWWRKTRERHFFSPTMQLNYAFFCDSYRVQKALQNKERYKSIARPRGSWRCVKQLFRTRIFDTVFGLQRGRAWQWKGFIHVGSGDAMKWLACLLGSSHEICREVWLRDCSRQRTQKNPIVNYVRTFVTDSNFNFSVGAVDCIETIRGRSL